MGNDDDHAVKMWMGDQRVCRHCNQGIRMAMLVNGLRGWRNPADFMPDQCIAIVHEPYDVPPKADPKALEAWLDA